MTDPIEINGAIKTWKQYRDNYKIAQPMQIVNTNDFKKVFLKMSDYHYHKIGRITQLDDQNKNYFNLICKYFAQDPEFEITHKGDLKKGLFIYGSNGTGKSSSMKIIENIFNIFNNRVTPFSIVNTNCVVQEFNKSKSRTSVIEKYSNLNRLFDDFGSEEIANNQVVFGKDEIFIKIMIARYINFIDKGTVTHITTNLNLEEIEIRYGLRVKDRFLEMFNFITLDGKSRR